DAVVGHVLGLQALAVVARRDVDQAGRARRENADCREQRDHHHHDEDGRSPLVLTPEPRQSLHCQRPRALLRSAISACKVRTRAKGAPPSGPSPMRYRPSGIPAASASISPSRSPSRERTASRARTERIRCGPRLRAAAGPVLGGPANCRRSSALSVSSKVVSPAFCSTVSPNLRSTAYSAT